MYSFSNKERWALAGMVVLLLPALLLNLGLVPFYAEEPRRATVALEMLLRDNWLVPTINGGLYYLKPPVFNWLLASWYQVSGYPSEFVTRLTTVISLLVLGLVMFATGKKYVSSSFGALSALLFVTASGNLFFNSLLAEIDIFYSLVTYTGLISLFHFYQKKQYLALFLAVYFLGAVGTLTKGLPSLLFTGLSVLVFFIAHKQFKRLFSPAHIAGIILYLGLLGAYFLVYSNYGDPFRYLLSLSEESGKRFSGDTFWDYLIHMIIYPLDTLWNILPASILIIFTFRRSFLEMIRGNPLMKFALLMLAVHFPVYWLPPGGRQRYIIMLYPFIIQIFTYFYLTYFNKEEKKFRIVQSIITAAIGLGALGCLVPPFLSQMSVIPYLVWICAGFFILMTGIFVFQLKTRQHAIFSLILSLIILRFFFGIVVLPVRATEGEAPLNRQAALDIAAVAGKKEVCILSPTYFPMQSVFYLEREQGQIVPVSSEISPGRLFIVEEYILANYNYRREASIYSPNPLKSYSDPFSNDMPGKFSEGSYNKLLYIKLKKRAYHLIEPIHPHL